MKGRSLAPPSLLPRKERGLPIQVAYIDHSQQHEVFTACCGCWRPITHYFSLGPKPTPLRELQAQHKVASHTQPSPPYTPVHLLCPQPFNRFSKRLHFDHICCPIMLALGAVAVMGPCGGLWHGIVLSSMRMRVVLPLAHSTN